MDLKELYNCIGGNYESAKSRMMKDSLIEKFVIKFLDDLSFSSLEESVNSSDWEKAFTAVHTLKGVALNMAFDTLAKKASELTDMLRPQNISNTNDKMMYDMFNELAIEYHNVIEQIKKYKSINLL